MGQDDRIVCLIISKHPAQRQRGQLPTRVKCRIFSGFHFMPGHFAISLLVYEWCLKRFK